MFSFFIPKSNNKLFSEDILLQKYVNKFIKKKNRKNVLLRTTNPQAKEHLCKLAK